MSVYIHRNDLEEIQQKVKFFINVSRFEAAEKLLKASIVQIGALANLHNLLGITFHHQSRFPEALTQFRLALKANPSFVEAAINLSATLCDLSRYEEAQTIFSEMRSYMDERKKIPQLLVGRLANQHAENGKLYLASNLFADAIEEFEKALNLFQPMLDVQMELVRTYLKLDQLEKARKELENILKIEPALTEARNLLGMVHFRLNRPDLARQAWQESSSQNPNDLAAQTLAKLSSSWNHSL